jgi:hypothetical protein
MPSSTGLAVFGSYRDIPVHVHVDCTTKCSSVSAIFAVHNNLPRTVVFNPLTTVATTTCNGLIVVPSETGFFCLSFQMDVTHFIRNQQGDIVLGQDWIAQSGTRVFADRILDPITSEMRSPDHVWYRQASGECSEFGHRSCK